MPKIKFLTVTPSDIDYALTDIIATGITDWEEVTPDEYDQLCDWVIRRDKKTPYWSTKSKFVMITEPVVDLPAVFEDYKRVMKTELEEAEARKKKAKKAAATRTKNKAAKEKKLLEDLKKKYE